LKAHLKNEKPILLGLSGGPDSMCLLHLLLRLKEKNPINLHLVHVNHGWRKESNDEQKKLLELANSLSLPFHTKKCFPEKYEDNLEAESRKDRLDFFCTIAKEIDAQAVLTAHH